MGNEWTTVGNISQVFDGPHATPKKIDEGPYFLSISSLENGKLDLSKSARLSEKDFEKWTKRITPCEGDVLFSYETRLGEAALMPSGIKACLGRRMGLLRPDREKVIPSYLLYAYLSPAFQTEIRRRTNPGATVDRLAIKELPDFPIRIPSLENQKAIAHILGSLDDKIELNRQMNETLEAMAQALFKSWFVDFDPVIDNALAAGNPIPEALQAKAAARQALGDKRKPLPEAIQQQFPSAFEFSEELGWIPEGWKVSSLTDLIEILGGGTPKTSMPEYWDGDIPWFAVVDTPSQSDIFVIDTSKHISQLGLEKSTAKLLPEFTTIISARGTVGKCAMTSRPMAMNQSCYGIRGKGEISDFFTYYTVIDSVSKLQQRSHGSIFNTITRDTLKTIKLPFGSEDLTEVFESTSKPNFEHILQNGLQVRSLISLRDTLLPKLLSGELRIPDAEKLVAEAL